ncbi:FtsW/RodA/SpoVE family cell cycle protein [Nonomuraea ferruginea]
MTPLQLARAYAALATDGKVRSPRIGWAMVRPDGKVVKTIPVPVVGRLPVTEKERRYIKNALSQVPSDGTAAGAFAGFPMDQVTIGGKTGTAEVWGKQDTSWFASFAPTRNPRFVVVVMVSQGGFGAETAAPAAREIYEGIFGIKRLSRGAGWQAGVGAADVPARRDGGARMTGGALAAGRRPFTRRVFGPESAVWRLDVVMLVAVAALLVLGSLLVWSSTRTWAPGSTGLLWKHLLNQVIGVALCLAVAMTDYRAVRAYAPVVYLVSLVGLGLVLTPLGATINGSHSWILLGGGFAVQPSEFAKVGLVLITSMLLAQPVEGTDRPRGLDVLLALVAAGITLVLVMLQPDLGTALVLAAVTASAMIISGVRKRLIALFTLIGAAGIFCVFFFDVLEPYQVARFTAFVDPSVDPRGVGYNSTQSLIAIGSGQLFGKGLLGGAGRPPAGSCRSSTPTSSSPWRARSSASSARSPWWRCSAWCCCAGCGSRGTARTGSAR